MEITNTIVGGLIGIAGAFFGGLLVKILEIRNERFLLTEKWMNVFRDEISGLISHSETLRLQHYHPMEPGRVEGLKEQYFHECKVRLLIKPEYDETNIQKDRIERDLNSELPKLREELDHLFGNAASKVVEKQELVLEKSRILLHLNWKDVKKGMEHSFKNLFSKKI